VIIKKQLKYSIHYPYLLIHGVNPFECSIFDYDSLPEYIKDPTKDEMIIFDAIIKYIEHNQILIK
jgi:hypothetical protein